MAFDTLTKSIRLLIGRRYTSTDLTDSQEAFASTIQLGNSEIWSQINLIPTASLPYSSSATPGTTVTSGVVKYWYKWPLTVANNTATGSSVWYFTSPTGSAAGIGSQLIDSGQQINFISPKYVSDSNIVNQSADADNNGNPPGYNIALFTSANGVTFTPLSPSASYQFDYKSGILEFTTTVVPSNRVYATVYQYVGRMLSDANDIVALTITASNISASGYISASNSNFATSSGQILNYNQITASSLVVFDNTTLGNSVNDIIRVTGSLSLSGSTSTNSSSFVDLTANRVVYTNQNQILTTDDDLIFDGNALTASNLLSNNVDINGGTIDGTTIGLTSATTAKFTEITASNISASGNISASNLWVNTNITDAGTLTVIGATTLAGLTGTSATFSGLVSASAGLTASSIQDSGTLTVIGNSTLSNVFATNITASNISASGYISSSTLHTINLVSENNILTNITSSNISASGNISSSTANINTITSNLINSVSGSFSNISASKITGGTTQLDTLSVLGNSTFYGDLTVYGSSSIVNISSSTVIIGDNRIQLNAWSTGSFSQRYAGLDLTDSGSSNTVTSSLLWDSLNNYWLLTNNQTGSNPTVTSSALIIQGPISDFGSEKQLPINTFLKVESAVGNLTSSKLTEVGSLLTYNGTVSSSAVSASSGFFSLDVLINGVLQVFSKIYAYAGIIGDVTGSLSGSSVITNTITASQITASQVVANTFTSSLTGIGFLGTASNAISSSYADYAATAGLAQNAQDILIYVKNQSGVVIPKGKVVRISGVDSGGSFGRIELADYSNENNSANTLGFANESFAINAFGYVITEGYLTGVDTSGFTSGDLLYLSSSGTYTNTSPIAPKHGVRLGQAVRINQNNGTIYVRIDNGIELGEAHNVIDNTTTSSYGDILVKSGSVWINNKNLTGSYTVTGSLDVYTGSFVYFNINNTGSAPTNYTSSGSPGEIRFDNNFIYIYTNNRWVRSPISKWE